MIHLLSSVGNDRVLWLVAAVLFAVTAILVLGWLLGGMVALARFRARCQPLENAETNQLLAEIAGLLGLPKRPRLLVGDGLESPVASGILQPAIVLPATFVVETRGDRLNVWVDPATNLPLLMERRHGNSSAAEQWTDFRFNEAFAASAFSLDVPAGFSVESRRAAQQEGAASSTTSERPKRTRAKTESYGFGPDITPKSR